MPGISSPCGPIREEAVRDLIGYAGDPFADADKLASAGAEIVQDMAEIPARIGIEAV